MATSVNIASEGLFYRVKHPEFDFNRSYKALAYVAYGESAWSYLLFVTHRGFTYEIRVDSCRLIARSWSGDMYLDLTAAQRETEWAMPVCKNPELHMDR